MKRIVLIIMTLLTMVMVSSFVSAETGRKNSRSLESLWKKYERAMDSDMIQDMAVILEDIKAQALKEKAPWNYIKACEEYVSVRSRRDWRLTDSLIKTLDRIPGELGEEYPGVPYLRYRGIMNSYGRVREEMLRELASDYAGRGISLLAEDELLLIKFYEMARTGASSADYRELEKEIRALEERCRALKGDETVVAGMCRNCSYILEQLKSVGATGGIVDGKAVLALRNLDKVGFRIVKDGRTVFDTVAVNETESFYRQDTVRVDIPVLADGSYTVLILDGDKTIGEAAYDKYTLALARRYASDGMCIYAADYMTGKPLEKADLLVYDSGMSLVAQVGDFVFDGFTPLPDDVYPFKDGDERYYIVCRYSDDGIVRMSRKMSLRNEDIHAGGERGDVDAVVLKDRAAFASGDTVKFKAILYEYRPDGGIRTVPEGYEAVVKIYDPHMESVSEKLLVTNEFGSVAGSFAIGGELMNGNYEIRVYGGREILGSGMFMVDDFVLPTYDLSFDKADRLYFPGDEVTVRGRVRNFTGHGFSGVRAVAELNVKYEKVGEMPVSIASDGSFEVSFKAGEPDDAYVGYGVIIRLTDSTGETLSFDYHCGAGSQISLEATLCNSNPLDDFETDVRRTGFGRFTSGKVLSEETAKILCRAGGYRDGYVDIPIDYELICEGKPVKSGRTRSGDTLSIDMSNLASGLYEFEMKASAVTDSGRSVSSSRRCRMLYLRKNDEVVPCETDRVFRAWYEDGSIVAQLGSGTGPIWAAVELFGAGNEVLKKELVHVGGKAGAPGSLVTVSFPHLEGYSDNLHLSLVYFRNGERYYYRRNFSRPDFAGALPLEFSVFEDKASPGQECTVRLKTEPGAEVAVSVFDVSSELIMNNLWREVRPDDSDVHVQYSWSLGRNGGPLMMVRGYGGSRKSKTTGAVMRMNAVMSDSAAADEEAAPFHLVAGGLNRDVGVRDDFSTTLAFEPFMRSSDDGSVDFKFRTSDKLSIFMVKVYAHDRAMNNSVAGREMLVTLPVKVSVMPPQYLYEGDMYVLNASVSNVSESSLKGRVYLEIYDGEEYADVGPVKIDSCYVDVPAGGSVSSFFEVPVPSGVSSLGFKVVFVGHEYSSSAAVNDVLISDGVFVPVPVYPAAQVLTEAHSAVLPGGGDAGAVLEMLRGEFVNVSSIGAEYSEISIMDIIREALPGAVEVDGRNAVSLSGGMYMNLLAAGLWARDVDSAGVVASCAGAAMDCVSGLLECANADGGFSWLEGGPSSPVVTALVLERYAGLRDRGLLDVVSELKGEDALDALDEAVATAVKYLDSSFFGDKDRPLWYGRLSLGQYLNVRSMFVGIPFDEDAAREAAGRKGYKEFRNEVKAYLIPKETRTAGEMLSKVRAVRIIIRLLDGMPQGFALRDAWGISSAGDVKRMIKVRDRELRSLKQYAVEHPSGGIYYPDAVMPWRGLLESEAYAHAGICDLFSDVSDACYGDRSLGGLADGIRVWLMLQKETQEWSADPGFVEALASVMDGSEAVRDTKILVLKKRYMKPFDRIEASGNGFRISADYYREGSDIPLSEGDSLHVGDRITAVYSLWSGENRSHVLLSVPRAACFRPAEQLSGWNGGLFRPLSYGFRKVSPYSYREVKADRTLWWIDVFPEQDTVLKEQLFVTQEGTFTSPVAEIESLYASHYRANEGFEGLVRVLQ